MNKFMTATFLAFILAKITSLNTKTHRGEIEEDIFSSILNPANNILEALNIDKISAYNFIDIGQDFAGSAHIINYLLTYIPIFFVILLLIGNIREIIQLLFTKKNHSQYKKNLTITIFYF